MVPFTSDGISDRGPESNFLSEYAESIMAHERFVGLFLLGIVRQTNEKAAVRMGELTTAATEDLLDTDRKGV